MKKGSSICMDAPVVPSTGRGMNKVWNESDDSTFSLQLAVPPANDLILHLAMFTLICLPKLFKGARYLPIARDKQRFSIVSRFCCDEGYNFSTDISCVQPYHLAVLLCLWQ